ncbi:MAG: hypothetical protein IKB51_01725 [Clostridia bacterium]|nr:hypothetical protein [Clostridia bacterium]
MKNSAKSIFSRSLSGFLAFMTVFMLLASLSLIPTLAAEKDRLFSDIWRDYYTNPEYNPETAGDKNMSAADFTTEQKRLEAMGEARYVKGDFELYVDEITGEVALLDTSTGDILFSNPYDISEYATTRDKGNHSLPTDTKEQLLSQVRIDYLSNNVGDSYYSFTDAALLDQVEITRLRGGVRVEYSIGEEETRMLIPRVMTVERWETMILDQLNENITLEVGESLTENPIAGRILAWYDTYYRSKYADEYYKTAREELIQLYPSFREEDIVVFDEAASYRQKKIVERYIKTYCPKYTFEELDKDHRDNQYTAKDKAPANFKMALEYYITDNGLEVRFPANGLTFDESNYQLSAVKILPYMGAGSNDYNGYVFIPDGSGTLIRFEDVERFDSISGSVYGEDYAYQEIGNANREVFRMPVFGVVTSKTPQKDSTLNEPYYKYNTYEDEAKTQIKETIVGPSKTPKTYSTGFVAIVTEGDALTKIVTESGGDEDHHFNSAYCSFNPRPKDSYNLSDAISVGGDGKVTVVSKRKYTGSFRINYIMLTDPENDGTQFGKGRTEGRTYYDASYVGMAKAYRDYLDNDNGVNVLDRLTENDVKADIPLYIEAFGVTETDEHFLSIPVTVKKAMTSFENLKTMVDEMAKAKVTNVSFRLTGYTNGGMKPTVPTKVKFERVVGGKDGFTDFLSYAAEKGIDVYPEFDFAYMTASGMLDGFNYDRDAVKTIDNRYITKREYDAVLQTFGTSGKICISPSVYREYFEKFNKSMTKILGGKNTGISLGTLGSDLNSDFDEDEPYNREDSKVFSAEMLGQFVTSSNYNKVMIDAGNSYAIKYANVVLNAPLDSSRYENASEAIPFFGMVYHGYIVFAGAPTNMAGDIKYEMLKILENGATLFMMLSYDNVELLKEDEYLSRYYAISYEIWKETLLSKYDEAGNVTSEGLYDKLNKALKGVQTTRINDHRFINCERQYTATEIDNINAEAKRMYDERYAEIDAFYQNALSRLALHDRVIAEFDKKLADAGVDAELEAIYAGDADAIAALKAQGTLSVLDAILNAVSGDAAKTEKYTALKADYDSEVVNRLVNYGVSDRIVIVGEAEYYKSMIDALDINKFREPIEKKYSENRKITDGSVVYVEYKEAGQAGTYFVLNYNSFIVEVDINGDGTIDHTVAPKAFVQGTVAA